MVELLAAYLKHAATYYRKDGRQTSKYLAIVAALEPLRELFGRQPADEFGLLKRQVVRDKLLERNARRTANKHVARIRRIFRWAVAQQLVPGRVYSELASLEGLKKGWSHARETFPIGPVDDAVVDATLPHLPPVVADMVRFQLYTGCRPQEVTLVRPMGVDRSKEPRVYTPQSHKTEHYDKP